MDVSAAVAAVVGWVRFAVLARRLSEREVVAVADQLTREGGPSSRVAISEAIMGITYELPSEADIARVAERLITGG